MGGASQGPELIPGHRHLLASQLLQPSPSLPALRPQWVSVNGHQAGVSQPGLS